ncbi:MAG TPA: hypothetical protein VNR65_15995 [Geobacterales bacterium]|nr:hypothetical protein [Geobacterales bacterium]
MQNVVAEKSFARAKFVADDKRIETSFPAPVAPALSQLRSKAISGDARYRRANGGSGRGFAAAVCPERRYRRGAGKGG